MTVGASTCRVKKIIKGSPIIVFILHRLLFYFYCDLKFTYYIPTVSCSFFSFRIHQLLTQILFSLQVQPLLSFQSYFTSYSISSTCIHMYISFNIASLHTSISSTCIHMYTLLLLLLTGTIFSYFCMSSSTSVLILAILIAIVLF